jgi:hypothetical protein
MSNLTPHGEALYGRLTGRQQAGIVDAHVPAPVAPLVAEPAEPDADDLGARLDTLQNSIDHVHAHVHGIAHTDGGDEP